MSVEGCDGGTRGTNMVAFGLSPCMGRCSEVLLFSAVYAAVFSLVGRGAGAELSPVGPVRAVRLTLTPLILIDVPDGVLGRCVFVQALRPAALRLRHLRERDQ